MTVRSTFLFVLGSLLVLAASAHADSLPSCGPGTHMVMNPTPPGAMHHGGAYCAPDDPSANPVPPVVEPTPPVVPPTAEVPPPPVAPPPPAAPPPAAAPAPSTGMCSVTLGRTEMSPILGIALALAFVAASRRR